MSRLECHWEKWTKARALSRQNWGKERDIRNTCLLLFIVSHMSVSHAQDEMNDLEDGCVQLMILETCQYGGVHFDKEFNYYRLINYLTVRLIIFLENYEN